MFLKLRNTHRKTPVLESLFSKFAAWQACSCFYVNSAKSLKVSGLKDICERLLQDFIDSKWT